MPAEDMTITAIWSVITYNITINLDGGTINETIPSTYTVESDDIILIIPTRTGYTFVGWTGSDLTVPTEEVIVKAGSTGDKEFTANWTPIIYTITYTLNGGTVEVANPETYTVETDTFKLNNPTKVGHTFLGWSGTGLTELSKEVTISKGSIEPKSNSF